MRWIGISGSRTTDDRVIADIEGDIAELMQRGDGLVAGGALGVDFHATREALKLNPAADRIRVIIPSRLATYREYFDRQLRAPSRNNNTFPAKIISLFQQLNALKSKGALVELSHVRVGTVSMPATAPSSNAPTSCAPIASITARARATRSVRPKKPDCP